MAIRLLLIPIFVVPQAIFSMNGEGPTPPARPSTPVEGAMPVPRLKLDRVVPNTPAISSPLASSRCRALSAESLSSRSGGSTNRSLPGSGRIEENANVITVHSPSGALTSRGERPSIEVMRERRRSLPRGIEAGPTASQVALAALFDGMPPELIQKQLTKIRKELAELTVGAEGISASDAAHLKELARLSERERVLIELLALRTPRTHGSPLARLKSEAAAMGDVKRVKEGGRLDPRDLADAPYLSASDQ